MTQTQFDDACDFCNIARGLDTTPGIMAEGSLWIAFFPLDPATPGHTLVVPRMHVPDLWSVDLELAAELMRAVVRVGQAVEHALSPDGMNLITSAGSAAEQTVFHLHLHVVPRWRQDGFGRIWPQDQRYKNATLDRAADRIRASFGR